MNHNVSSHSFTVGLVGYLVYSHYLIFKTILHWTSLLGFWCTEVRTSIRQTPRKGIPEVGLPTGHNSKFVDGIFCLPQKLCLYPYRQSPLPNTNDVNIHVLFTRQAKTLIYHYFTINEIEHLLCIYWHMHLYFPIFLLHNTCLCLLGCLSY